MVCGTESFFVQSPRRSLKTLPFLLLTVPFGLTFKGSRVRLEESEGVPPREGGFSGNLNSEVG